MRVSPIDESKISIITSELLDRAVIEIYMYGRSDLKNKEYSVCGDRDIIQRFDVLLDVVLGLVIGPALWFSG